MRSSFDGHIDEIPFILVDNFENDLSKNAYFLSHYHGDHVFGLNDRRLPGRLKKNNAFIYGSEVTIAIIIQTLPELEPYLKILLLGRNTIPITTDNNIEVFLNVTTLPAGHSLGSTMFLFEHNNLKILYTGDFRITPNSVAKLSHFHLEGEPIRLDALYVDTTFQEVPMFPKRSEVVRNVILHIKNWLNLSEKHRVVLLTSAMYGYEYVCNEIFKETGIKTKVPDFSWNIYSQFKNIQGVTNDYSSRIHLTTKYCKIQEDDPFKLEVYFSAMLWGRRGNIDEEYINIEDRRIEVCFSTHCSRDELVYFINYFNPKKVIGFPNAYAPLKTALEGDICTNNNVEFIKMSPKKRKLKTSKERNCKKVNSNVVKEAFDW